LNQSKHHWEEVFWWILAGSFGITVNACAFEAIARSISTQILGKHKNRPVQLEALLLGQAGLLDRDFSDAYPLELNREFRFLKKKYQLTPIHQQVHFLRMRPENFPTIRLSQLASLIHASSHLFSRVREAESIREIRQMFSVTASAYWKDHYVFEEPAPARPKMLGRQMQDSILINALAPMLFAYGVVQQEDNFAQKAFQWLEKVAPEKNSIVKKWQALGMDNQHASDSQALLELKTHYCDKKRCLECAIGNALLGSTGLSTDDR